jgi:hypothetical protein
MMTKNFLHGMTGAYDGGMSMPSIVAAAALAVSPVHVTLVFAPPRPVPAAVQRAAITEAAAIWSPYNVVVTGAEPLRIHGHDDLTLTVEMNRTPATMDPMWRAPLGAVDFDEAGAPFHIITVFIVRLVTMIEEARLWHVPAWEWPRVIREQVVGRAMGRVIAHEIGHVLLRTTRHAPHGLMRAVQRADELVDPSRNRYRLPD